MRNEGLWEKNLHGERKGWKIASKKGLIRLYRVYNYRGNLSIYISIYLFLYLWRRAPT